jgi:hypothetical protein
MVVFKATTAKGTRLAKENKTLCAFVPFVVVVFLL